MKTDVKIETVPGGSIVMIQPISAAAKEWVADNTDVQDWQWMGPSFGIEPRLAGPLVEGMREAGLVVRPGSIALHEGSR